MLNFHLDEGSVSLKPVDLNLVVLNNVIRELGSFARAQFTNRIKNKPINQMHMQITIIHNTNVNSYWKIWWLRCKMAAVSYVKSLWNRITFKESNISHLWAPIHILSDQIIFLCCWHKHIWYLQNCGEMY